MQQRRETKMSITIALQSSCGVAFTHLVLERVAQPKGELNPVHRLAACHLDSDIDRVCLAVGVSIHLRSAHRGRRQTL